MPPKQKARMVKDGGGKGETGSSSAASSSATVRKVVIVESKTKCKTIEKYLGENYRCIASNGHFRTLDLKGIDLATGSLHFQIDPAKKRHVQEMREVLSYYRPENVILASDDDREGEAIAWHLCQVFGLPVATTARIVFHEITRPAIQAAMAAPRTIDMRLVEAQHARQVLDILVGFKVSPVLWRTISMTGSNGTALSAGRCQTPALHLIYEIGKKEIEQGRAEFEQRTPVQYALYGAFLQPHWRFRLNRIFTSDTDVEAFLAQSQTFEHRWHLPTQCLYNALTETESPPRPYKTSTLMQAANARLRLSTKTTMKCCQILYQKGLITYMRTDSEQFSAVFLDQVRHALGPSRFWNDERHLRELTAGCGGGASASASGAHEAIHVTDVTRISASSSVQDLDPDEDEEDDGDGDHLDGSNRGKPGKHGWKRSRGGGGGGAGDPDLLNQVYRLIWENSMQACMCPAQYKVLPFHVTAPMDAEYAFRYRVLTIAGWRELAPPTSSTTHFAHHDHEDSGDALADDGDGDGDSGRRTLEELTAWQMRFRSTKQPPLPIADLTFLQTRFLYKAPFQHYTEGKLVKTLESLGIGRPSTMAMILDVIQTRGYVVKRDVEGRLLTYQEWTMIVRPPQPPPPCTSTRHTHPGFTSSASSASSWAVQKTNKSRLVGGERQRLCIEPLGMEVCAFLTRHFQPLFDYGYTKHMEEELDNVAKGIKPWTEIGIQCASLIDQCIAQWKTIKKQNPGTGDGGSHTTKTEYPVLPSSNPVHAPHTANFRLMYLKGKPVLYREKPAAIPATSPAWIGDEDDATRLPPMPEAATGATTPAAETMLVQPTEEKGEPGSATDSTAKKTRAKKTAPKAPKPPKPPKAEREWVPVRPDVLLDPERLEKGLYRFDELAPTAFCTGLSATNTTSTAFANRVGSHPDRPDVPVLLKTGPYGAYLEFCLEPSMAQQQRVSLASVMKRLRIRNPEQLSWETHLLPLLRPATAASGGTQGSVLREFVPGVLSIRQGRYGPYVFYKDTSVAATKPNTKPRFFALKGLPLTDVPTISVQGFQQWMLRQHNTDLSAVLGV